MESSARVFLDAARLGAMSSTAQKTARDFARLAGEGLSTLYWEQFFRGHRSSDRFPGLAHWRGVREFTRAVRRLVAAPSTAPVLLASRTTALMQAAVDLLACSSRRILTTDSLWPPYRQLLEQACTRHGTEIVTMALRDDVFEGRVSRGQLVRRLASVFALRGCDGALFSSVSHDGVRLPLRPVVAALRRVYPHALIVADGAQEFAHVPVSISKAPCDVYVAGAHKWLGAYQPLGMAVLPHSPSSAALSGMLSERLTDPLFRYVQSLQGTGRPSPPETVNLTPLVCASGALHDALEHPRPQARRFRRQLSNVRCVVAAAPAWGWSPHELPSGLQTGILLLQSLDPVQSWIPAPELQAELSAAGVVLTVSPGGVVRLSLPGRRICGEEWDTLQRALHTCGARARWELMEAA